VELPRHPVPASIGDRARRLRRRGLVLFAALVVLLHATALGGAGWPGPRPGAPSNGPSPMALRGIELQPDPAALGREVDLVVIVPAAIPPDLTQPAQAMPSRRSPPRLSTRTALAADAAIRVDVPDVTSSGEPEVAEATAVAAAPAAEPGPSETGAADRLAAASSVAVRGARPPASAASNALLAAGETPPPIYPTRLPASMSLRYEVRRGFLRGDGRIRWQRAGNSYTLSLEASVGGLNLLTQTSQGVIDRAGLAPTRFLDQRARRAAQAANFNRDAGTVTFSGPSVVWPLLPGTQDRLSWMIQLAGIVAADPQQAGDGGSISMVIVGARGEAALRTLRFAGREDAQTAGGSVPALKFEVAARSVQDASFDIWLDPAHAFFPVRATQRNGAGEVEFELLLQRIDASP
jgi:hypothetical protein